MGGTMLRFEAAFGREELIRVREKARTCLGLLGVDGPQAGLYISVVDEVCGNILEHGDASWVELHFGREDDKVRLQFRDDGPAFDPVSAIEGYGEDFLDKETERGLGLYMVGRFAHDCRYRRDEGVNELVFERRVE